MEEKVIRKFLDWIEEDMPFRDETTELLLPAGTVIRAHVIAKKEGIIACVSEVVLFLKHIGLRVNVLKNDGEKVTPNDVVMEIIGDARKILAVERTILNLLGHCSGIATITRKLVEKAKKVNPRIRIAATRKTLPGLRYFEKKAVIIGGGDPHRYSLSDMILIKDNHLKIVGSVREAIKRARRASFTKKIEVEVESIDEMLEAVEAGADIIMLDNFKPSDVGKAVEELKKRGMRDRVVIEVSGGITPENIDEYLKHDIDVISLGWITHSAPSLDLSLEVVEVIR
ncbi:MAG: carboxylating nicotinate-nucleotide diphosphorylase [Thermoprotei archaeon]